MKKWWNIKKHYFEETTNTTQEGGKNKSQKSVNTYTKNVANTNKKKKQNRKCKKSNKNIKRRNAVGHDEITAEMVLNLGDTGIEVFSNFLIKYLKRTTYSVTGK